MDRAFIVTGRTLFKETDLVRRVELSTAKSFTPHILSSIMLPALSNPSPPGAPSGKRM